MTPLGSVAGLFLKAALEPNRDRVGYGDHNDVWSKNSLYL
jgi:hypothetical protein